MNEENIGNDENFSNNVFYQKDIEAYLVPPTRLDEEKFKFSVITPKRIKWLLILLITYFLDFLFIKAFSGVGLLLIILIAYFASSLWNKSYSLIIKKLLIPGLIQWKEVKEEGKLKIEGNKGIVFKTAISLIGFKIYPEYTYFLEAETKDLDLSSVTRVFKNKYFDLISASAGISFLLAAGLDNIIHNAKFSLLIAIIAMVLSPLLIFWIIPVMWIIEDSRVRVIDEKNTITRLSDNVRHGILNKILGVGGLLVGYGFLSSRSEELWGAVNQGLGASISIAITSVVILLALIFSIAGTAYLVAMIYLTKHHERHVNEFRNEVKEIIPVAMTIVKEVKLVGNKVENKSEYKDSENGITEKEGMSSF